MLPLSDETKMILDFESNSESESLARVVMRIVGPMVQVLYIFSCASKDGSLSDSVAKYPAVMMTMSICEIELVCRKLSSFLPASGDEMSIPGM